MEDTKKCTKCDRELPLDQFYIRKYRTGNISRCSYCKSCSNAQGAAWKKANKEKVRIQRIAWRRNNPEKIKAIKARSDRKNSETCRIAGARWRRNHPEYKAKYLRRMRLDKPEFKMMENIRRVINLALRGNVKAGRAIELLGCTDEYLCNHLEKQFLPGMTWDNYGRNGWHIDHIIPLSYFDFSDPEQQKRAWHYTNLQPLWAGDNIRKSNKIEERQLLLL